MQCQWHHWAVYCVLGNFGFTFIDARASGLLGLGLRRSDCWGRAKMKMLLLVDARDHRWWWWPLEVVNVFMPSFCLACLYSYILLCKSLTLCVPSRVPVTTWGVPANHNCQFEMLLLTFRLPGASMGLQNKRLRQRTRH